MRLIECYIENFGMLAGYKHSFTSGVNTIYAKNGEGKTTLSVFIKSMLYGLEDTRAHKLDENDRKKYYPWQGGKFGGSLTFEYKGSILRVEREFGKKASDDTVRVVAVESGVSRSEYETQLGEKIFGIDRDGFEATVFLSEKNITVGKDNMSTIQTKLSDVVEADGATDAFENARKLLENEAKVLQKRGGSGEIAQLEEKMRECKRAIDEADTAIRQLASVEEKLNSAHERLDLLIEKRKLLTVKKDEEAARAGRLIVLRQYKSFLEREREARERLSGLETFFTIGSKDIDELNEVIRASNSLRALESKAALERSPELVALDSFFKCETSSAQIYENKARLEEVERLTLERETLAKKLTHGISTMEAELGGRIPEVEELLALQKSLGKKKSPVLPISLISFGAVAVILGVVMLLLPEVSPVFGIAAFGVAAVCATVGIILALLSGKSGEASKLAALGLTNRADIPALIERVKRHYETKEADELRIAELDKKICEAVESLAQFIAKYPVENPHDKRAALEEIGEKLETYKTLKIRETMERESYDNDALSRASYRERVETYLKKYPTVTENPFGEIGEKITEYHQARATLQAYEEERVRYVETHNIAEGEADNMPCEVKTDEITLEIDNVINEERLVGEEITKLETEEKDIVDYIDRLNDIIGAKEMLSEKIDSYKKKHSVILKTLDYLKEAAETMTSRYIGRTRERFAHYQSMISGREMEYSIDTKFTLQSYDRGETRPIDSYSRGTRDLYNLALRLALVDSLYTEEIPPIILDDPFLAFDDERIEGAKEVVRKIGKERQIIYLTCSQTRAV